MAPISVAKRIAGLAALQRFGHTYTCNIHILHVHTYLYYTHALSDAHCTKPIVRMHTTCVHNVYEHKHICIESTRICIHIYIYIYICIFYLLCFCSPFKDFGSRKHKFVCVLMMNQSEERPILDSLSPSSRQRANMEVLLQEYLLPISQINSQDTKV